MKKYFTLLLIFIFSVTGVCVNAATESNIDVVYHGKSIVFDAEPYYLNGRIMVPVRAIFEAIGAKVDWDDETQTATATMDDTTVTMQCGSSQYMINGTEYTMDAEVEKHSDRIFAPVRYVAQGFGRKISYHQNSETAYISDSNEYNYYENLSVAVPDFSFVYPSSLSESNKTENGNLSYTYTCSDNGITDYLNFLQLDFGYDIYNMQYLENAVNYIYAKGNHLISVTESWDGTDVYKVEIIPDSTGSYSLEITDDIDKEEVPPLKENAPVMDDITYSDADYGKITGSELLEVYTKGENKFYVYSYDMALCSYYEMYIEANGWQLYDFKIDIDTFSHSKFWVKDDVMICLSVGFFSDTVIVSIMH